MKIAKACQQCRTGKRKCHQDTKDRPCRHCSIKNLPCSSVSKAAMLQQQAKTRPRLAAKDSDRVEYSSSIAFDERQADKEAAIRLSQANDGDGTTLSEDETAELVRLYLHFIHDKPHSFFHKLTLWKSIRDKSINRPLLLAICGVGARFSQNPKLRNSRVELVARSKRLLHTDIENVCLENVQTCVLLANTCAADLDMSAEALYFGIANRMAHLLMLHKTNSKDPPVVQETKSRTWWTLVMADTWCSSGLGIPRQLADPRRHAELPIDESVFQSFSEDDVPTISSLPLQPGLWAHMIALVEIFAPIQQLNRQLADEPDSVDGDARSDETVAALKRSLDSWIGTLPRGTVWNAANLEAFKGRDLGGAFVALHLGYHHYATLLYFQYLDRQRSATPSSELYVRMCRYHAQSYSEVLRASREMAGCEAVHQTVGHMTVVSSSVLLHVLLFGDADEIPAAKASLCANFAALVELKVYWPKLDGMIDRLLIFQNACLRDADANTHRIDRWMVRFLLEFALPLESKSFDVVAPMDVASSPEITGGKVGFEKRRSITNRALADLFQ